MNGTNGKQSDFPDVALVPYPVIVAATKGDPDAMKIVLQHFSGYIASLSMRKLCDERGNVYFGVDEDIRQRLQARLMRASPAIPVFPMLKTVEQMSKISGIGENKLRELMDSGELEYIQNGNRRLIADAAIWDWYHRAKTTAKPPARQGG